MFCFVFCIKLCSYLCNGLRSSLVIFGVETGIDKSSSKSVFWARKQDRETKKRQEMSATHTHTHPQTRKKGYVSMLHTLLGGTHCMNEAVMRVFLCLLSVSNRAYVHTLTHCHVRVSLCESEPLLTKNLFFFWAVWECWLMKSTPAGCVRRACGHAWGGSSVRHERLMPRGRAIRQKRGTDQGGAQDRQRMMTTRIQTETGGQ